MFKEVVRKIFKRNEIINSTQDSFRDDFIDCDYYICAIPDAQAKCIGIVIANEQRHLCVTKTFSITLPNESKWDTVHLACTKDVDKLSVIEFIKSSIVQNVTIKTVIDIPFYDKIPTPEPINMNSIHMVALFCLNKGAGATFKGGTNEENEGQDQFTIIPEWLLNYNRKINDLEKKSLELELADMLDLTSRHVPWLPITYLKHGIARAYSVFLFGENTLSSSAISLFLISKNKGVYLYFTSIGRVHSSGDILFFIKNQLRESRVVTPSGDVYSIELTPSTSMSNIDDIPLEYALAMKKYEYLQENDRLKMALLEICRSWKLQLSCSNLDDFQCKENEYVVYNPDNVIFSLPQCNFL